VKRKFYLIGLDSNTGTDRVIESIVKILKSSGEVVEVLSPTLIGKKYFKFVRIDFCLIPGYRIIGMILLEILLIIRLIRNKNHELYIISFVYPLWTPFTLFGTKSSRYHYFFFLPDTIWKKKYVISARWILHSITVGIGIRLAKIILVPSSSAQLDFFTFYKKNLHKKIRRLSTPVDAIYWHNLNSKPVYGLQPMNFIFHPAGNKPSKNTEMAKQAFKILSIKNLNFVYLNNNSNSLKVEADHVSEEEKGIVRLNDVTDEEMKWLYENSLFVSVVSIEEGVGLPILEALIFKKTVVSSHISAMPEVAGKSAILVDPFDEKNIAWGYSQAIKQSINNQVFNKEPVESQVIYGQKSAKELLYALNLTNNIK
jgi:glycosyltransferase involved in cell wall biosynthesis